MSKFDALISPRRAASIIGVHHNTVYEWCARTESGEPSPLPRVERAENGYMQVPLADALAVVDNLPRKARNARRTQRG